jgi:ABC-type transport system substrate-binding protein
MRERTGQRRQETGRRERSASIVSCFLFSVSWFYIIFNILGCSDPLPPPIPAEHPADETPRRGGTIRLASFADIRSLDPAVAASSLDAAVLQLLYAGLIEIDSDGKIVPDLATRWEVADEGRTYRFFLREGARFHDGEEVTAADVKRSVERALHPTTPNPFAEYFEGLVGYKEYFQNKAKEIAGVAVQGKYVVTFELREPDATFLSMVAAFHTTRPVCRSAGDRYSDSFYPCGAGPFKLPPNGWERGRGVTVVRHDAYYRPGEPYLDAVQWTYGMAITTARYKLTGGELDILREFTQPDIVRFITDPRWKDYGFYEPEVTINGEAMNVEMPPFDNVEVRRAVAAALDRDQIVKVKPTAMRKATQVIPNGVPLFDPTFEGQKHDYAAALEHMRRAGLAYDPATGQGGWPHPIHVYVYKPGLYEYTEQVVQQQLAKIGLRLELHVVNYASFLSITRRRGRVGMAPSGWKQDYPDPHSFFESLFASSSINDEDSNNQSFYKNPELDALLARGKRELDPERRKALYREANRIVCDDAPFAFTFVSRYYIVRQPYVRGFRPNPQVMNDVRRTWLDRASSALASTTGPLSGRGLASLMFPRTARTPSEETP